MDYIDLYDQHRVDTAVPIEIMVSKLCALINLLSTEFRFEKSSISVVGSQLNGAQVGCIWLWRCFHPVIGVGGFGNHRWER